MPVNNFVNSIKDFLFRQALIQSANLIAKRARAEAPTKRIEGAIYVSTPVQSGNTYSIEIGADLDKAPEARAYELGSGIHSQSGAKYPIIAKNAPNLVFYWEREGRYFVGKKVNHPGVEARPYLKPAIEDTQADIRALFGKALSDLIIQSINQTFKQAQK